MCFPALVHSMLHSIVLLWEVKFPLHLHFPLYVTPYLASLVTSLVSYFACHIHSRHVPLTPFNVQGAHSEFKEIFHLGYSSVFISQMKANVIMLTSAF